MNFRYIEAFIITLMSTIAGCFWYEIIISQPDVPSILTGLIPSTEILTNPQMLYISIGIIGRYSHAA